MTIEYQVAPGIKIPISDGDVLVSKNAIYFPYELTPKVPEKSIVLKFLSPTKTTNMHIGSIKESFKVMPFQQFIDSCLNGKKTLQEVLEKLDLPDMTNMFPGKDRKDTLDENFEINEELLIDHAKALKLLKYYEAIIDNILDTTPKENKKEQPIKPTPIGDNNMDEISYSKHQAAYYARLEEQMSKSGMVVPPPTRINASRRAKVSTATEELQEKAEKILKDYIEQSLKEERDAAKRLQTNDGFPPTPPTAEVYQTVASTGNNSLEGNTVTYFADGDANRIYKWQLGDENGFTTLIDTENDTPQS